MSEVLIKPRLSRATPPSAPEDKPVILRADICADDIVEVKALNWELLTTAICCGVKPLTAPPDRLAIWPVVSATIFAVPRAAICVEESELICCAPSARTCPVVKALICAGANDAIWDDVSTATSATVIARIWSAERPVAERPTTLAVVSAAICPVVMAAT